jgi:hypothetical protein
MTGRSFRFVAVVCTISTLVLAVAATKGGHGMSTKGGHSHGMTSKDKKGESGGHHGQGDEAHNSDGHNGHNGHSGHSGHSGHNGVDSGVNAGNSGHSGNSDGNVHETRNEICGNEFDICTCKGAVIYGKGETFSAPVHVDGSIGCLNENFGGDPLPDHDKECRCIHNVASNVEKNTWCAIENNDCSCENGWVTYGFGDQWVDPPLQVFGVIGCNDEEFQNVAHVPNFLNGQYKECRCIVRETEDFVTRTEETAGTADSGTDHHHHGKHAAALENDPTASAAGNGITTVAMIGATLFAVAGAAFVAVTRRQRKMSYSPEEGVLLTESHEEIHEVA